MKRIMELFSRVGDKKDKSLRRGIVSRKLLGEGRHRASGFGNQLPMSMSEAAIRRPSHAKKNFAKSRSDSKLLRSLPTKLVDEYILAFDDLSFGEKIGAGGNGQVFRGILDGRIPVAIKQLYSQMMVPTNVEDFKKEAIALAEVAHPGVVRFYGITEDAGKLYIVTELCPTQVEDLLGRVPRAPGSLDGILHKLRGLQVAADVADTMASLHMRGIVHLDLKPENLLVDAEQQVKICDFGLAATISRAGICQKDWRPLDSKWSDTMNDARSYQHGGSPPYVPPEMLSIVFSQLFDANSDLNCNWVPMPPATSAPACRPRIAHSHSIREHLDAESIDCRSVDVYAFGVMLWALWHRTKPFARIRTRVREAAVAAFIAQYGGESECEFESKHEEKSADPALEHPCDGDGDGDVDLRHDIPDGAVVIPRDETKKATKEEQYPRYPLAISPVATPRSVVASVNSTDINNDGDTVDNRDDNRDDDGGGDDGGDNGDIDGKDKGTSAGNRVEGICGGTSSSAASRASSSYNTKLFRLKDWVEYASWNDLVVIGVSKYKLRPIIDEDCEPRVVELLRQCWHEDPKQRPTFMEVGKQVVNIMRELFGLSCQAYDGTHRLGQRFNISRRKEYSGKESPDTPQVAGILKRMEGKQVGAIMERFQLRNNIPSVTEMSRSITAPARHYRVRRRRSHSWGGLPDPPKSPIKESQKVDARVVNKKFWNSWQSAAARWEKRRSLRVEGEMPPLPNGYSASARNEADVSDASAPLPSHDHSWSFPVLPTVVTSPDTPVEGDQTESNAHAPSTHTRSASSSIPSVKTPSRPNSAAKTSSNTDASDSVVTLTSKKEVSVLDVNADAIESRDSDTLEGDRGVLPLDEDNDTLEGDRGVLPLDEETTNDCPAHLTNDSEEEIGGEINFELLFPSYQPRCLRDKMTPSEVGNSSPSKSLDSLSSTSPTLSENIQSTPSDNEDEEKSHPVGVQERPGNLGMRKIFENDHDGAAEDEHRATEGAIDWYDKLVGSTSCVDGKARDEQACEVISRATALFARGLITATELNKICDRGNFFPSALNFTKSAQKLIEHRAKTSPSVMRAVDHNQIEMLQAFDERCTGVWLNVLGVPRKVARDLVFASVSISELQDFTEKDFSDFGIKPALQTVLKTAAHAYTFTPTLRGGRLRRWLSRGTGISATMAERIASSGLCGGELLDMSLAQLRALAISSCYDTDVTVLSSYQSLLCILSGLRDQRHKSAAAAKRAKKQSLSKQSKPSPNKAPMDRQGTKTHSSTKALKSASASSPDMSPSRVRLSAAIERRKQANAKNLVTEKGRLLLQAAHSNTPIETVVTDVAATVHKDNLTRT